MKKELVELDWIRLWKSTEPLKDKLVELRRALGGDTIQVARLFYGLSEDEVEWKRMRRLKKVRVKDGSVQGNH